MPAKYEAIRDKEIERGRTRQEAERVAAAIFNKQRKPGQKPVTGHHSKGQGAKR